MGLDDVGASRMIDRGCNGAENSWIHPCIRLAIRADWSSAELVGVRSSREMSSWKFGSVESWLRMICSFCVMGVKVAVVFCIKKFR